MLYSIFSDKTVCTTKRGFICTGYYMILILTNDQLMSHEFSYPQGRRTFNLLFTNKNDIISDILEALFVILIIIECNSNLS